MTNYMYTGAALANYKAVSINPGVNVSSHAIVVIGLGPYQLTTTGWIIDDIVTAWNTSSNPFFQQIVASKSDNELILTCNTLGMDFEVTCTVNGVDASGAVNAVQILNIVASGGTFTLSDGTYTSGNITYNATPATLIGNMQTAINAMTGYSAGDVVVSYDAAHSYYKLSFGGGRFAGLAVPLWTGNAASLTGGTATATITAVRDGNAGQDEIISISFPANGTHTEIINEIQQITMGGSVTSGTFTLTVPGFGTTAAIPFNAGRSVIKTALENLLGLDTTIVTGGPLSSKSNSGQTNHYHIDADHTGCYSPYNHTNGRPGWLDAATNGNPLFTDNSDVMMTRLALVIPPGSTIQSAILTLDAFLPIGSHNITVTAYNAGHDAAFPTDYATATTAFAAAGAASAVFTLNPSSNRPQTVDIANVVTQCIAQSGWTAGDHILVFIKADLPSIQWGPVYWNGSAYVYSQLDITYVLAGTNGTWGSTTAGHIYVPTTTWSGGTFNGQFNAYGYVAFYDSDVINIPQGATISQFSNSISCAFGGTAPYPTNGRVFGVLPGHAYPTNYASALAAYQAPTTAYVDFTISGSAPINLDLSTIAQEIVNNGGWTSGSKMVFFMVSMDAAASASYVAGTFMPNTTGIWSYASGSAYTYLPVKVEFTGSLGGSNISQMTTSGLATISAVQDGGSQTIQNITGGTWTLNVVRTRDNKLFSIPNIPYNATATILQALITSVLGSGTATVTGGPAPGTPLVIHFTGGFATTALTESLVVSLTGNFGSSANLTELRPARLNPDPANIWDLTLIPGAGTLGIAQGDPLTTRGFLKMTIITPNADNPVLDLGNNVVIFLPIYQISPRGIEDAINEAFGRDVVRVTRTVHSLEHMSLPTHTGASAVSAAAPLHFWYFKDVFRLVFVNDYQAKGTISSIQIRFAEISNVNANPAGPSSWMVHNASPASSDVDDMYYETERTYQGFVALASTLTPLHLVSITQFTGRWRNSYSFRAKLIPQYASTTTASQAATPQGGGNESDQNAFRVGLAKQFQDQVITLQWCKHIWTADTDQYPGEISLATCSFNWDAPASQIQAQLETMLSGFCGTGNVKVTGSFFNSWMSEGAVDAPDSRDAYNDLRIEFTGALARLPLNESGYEFRATISNPHINNYQQQKNPLMWIEPYSKPTPGGINQRLRFTMANPAAVTALQLVIDGVNIATTPQMTASDLQTLIASTLGRMPAINPPIAPFTVGEPIPDRNLVPVTVYGTDLTQPIELEFTGFGYQFTEHTVSFGVYGDASIMTVTETQTGIDPVQEVQALSISGNPLSGTYTVHGSGNITYNASAATIQTAIGSPSGTIATVTGTYPSFLLTWPSASGNVGLWATTSSLNNSSVTIRDSGDGTQSGGKGANLSIMDVTQGTGPEYFDCPQNYTPVGVPGAGDTLTIDDATSPIYYGLDQSSLFQAVTLSAALPASGTIFQYKRNRQVFQNNQKVFIHTAGTIPTGLTNNTTYYIVNQAPDYTFQLSATPGGAAIACSDVGVGDLLMTTKGLILIQYHRYSGGQIGLPNINSSTGLPEYLPKYLKLDGPTVTIGEGSDGNGVQLFRLDTMNNQAAINVKQTGQSSISPLPTVLLLFNNAASTLQQLDGDVGIAVYSNESSSLNTIDCSGGSSTLHNVTFAGHANYTNGVKPIIEGTCTVNGTTLMV